MFDPEKHHRRSILLKGYDYSQAGLYFITICCHNRECLFGKIVHGEMKLNQYGQIAYNEWLKTPQIRQNVTSDVFVIMPNHMHAIIRLFRRGEMLSPQIHAPENMNEMNSTGITGDTHGIVRKGENISPLRGPSQTVGAIVRGYKSAVTKQLNELNINSLVWQRNYYEHIIRDEHSYLKISEYIKNNPANWDKDSLK